MRYAPRHECFWQAEEVGSFVVLRFTENSLSAVFDLNRVATLWDFFESLQAGSKRVLLILFPPQGFSPAALDQLWDYVRQIPENEYSGWPGYAPQAGIELGRANVAMQRFMGYVRDSRYYVIAAYSGEIDVNLLGLLLACDYRIVADHSVIINRQHPFSATPGTGVPWFLIRLLGETRTTQVLLKHARISASEAAELGLFHELIPQAAYEQQAITIARSLAANSPERLAAIKRAVAASESPLDDYLGKEGAGFSHLPDISPHCVNCGYDLTGNVSGTCPECGRPAKNVPWAGGDPFEDASGFPV